MIRILPFVIAAFAACASHESPVTSDAPLVVARVEQVDGPGMPDQEPQGEGPGPIAIALQALEAGLTPGRAVSAAMLLTQTGERIRLALGPETARAPMVGDCVGVVPLDPDAGLRLDYGRGEARLVPSRACGELAR